MNYIDELGGRQGTLIWQEFEMGSYFIPVERTVGQWSEEADNYDFQSLAIEYKLVPCFPPIEGALYEPVSWADKLNNY